MPRSPSTCRTSSRSTSASRPASANGASGERTRRGTVSTVNEELLDRYAELIVGYGANVQPDQVVAVEGQLEAAPLMHRIARGAYERGARYVDAVYFDAQVKRIRLESAPEDSLEWVPPWLGRRMLDLGELEA